MTNSRLEIDTNAILRKPNPPLTFCAAKLMSNNPFDLEAAQPLLSRRFSAAEKFSQLVSNRTLLALFLTLMLFFVSIVVALAIQSVNLSPPQIHINSINLNPASSSVLGKRPWFR
ncbi:hypothetical protein BWQ96_00278 [Gracilariopsis chorda]|uniref:Uncharacterized protein n=1 Tax=Gracilariopsis chorda TaxID=448386 RepID=A0A2V3J6R5_9FLOR|nr:hypothetical protein BWQ96_00278 [Gracilariopsis chorda]|eukprot:PXF50118.1 hypothetical protein BWQ96_00278 [Gracilariopsis chorda]